MRKQVLYYVLVNAFIFLIVFPLFGPEVSVYGPVQYVRGSGQPVTDSRTFTSPVTGTDLVLRIVNGDSQGEHRASSGRVVLNGEEIVSPAEFKKKIETIEKTVTIHDTNAISITLNGKPGSFITLGIYGFAPEPEVTLSADPESIFLGESSTLEWTSQYADTVSIDNGIGSVALNGSVTVSPQETVTYTVAATGPGGTATASATVTVQVNIQDQTIIYGRVFSAGTHEPLPQAVISSEDKEVESDSDGYWRLVFGEGGLYKISITKPGYTQVNRKIYLETGREGVVDNAFLTLVDSKSTAIGPEGGTHANSDGSVEVIIPAGALDEVRDIRATRIASAEALPGDLNETPNLEYPISFLFCADFGPDGTTFNTPVTIRVQNSWGFEPATEIPFAYWDPGSSRSGSPRVGPR